MLLRPPRQLAAPGWSAAPAPRAAPHTMSHRPNAAARPARPAAAPPSAHRLLYRPDRLLSACASGKLNTYNAGGWFFAEVLLPCSTRSNCVLTGPSRGRHKWTPRAKLWREKLQVLALVSCSDRARAKILESCIRTCSPRECEHRSLRAKDRDTIFIVVVTSALHASCRL